ncbi:hypothetical protein GGS20DRAFT_553065 [Poronia punctata]|nr:hypothetical protein GGS20DRAFT_553065 [Poronia punctata]
MPFAALVFFYTFCFSFVIFIRKVMATRQLFPTSFLPRHATSRLSLPIGRLEFYGMILAYDRRHSSVFRLRICVPRSLDTHRRYRRELHPSSCMRRPEVKDGP